MARTFGPEIIISHRQPVAATPFGGIHGQVGVTQHGRPIGGYTIGAVGQPNTGPDHHGIASHHKRSAHIRYELFTNHYRVFHGGSTENYHELVSAEAEHVGMAHHRLEPTGHLDEHIIASIVAPGIVDHLEPIQITQQYAYR